MMKDMGKKQSNTLEAVPTKEKSKIFYPSISMNSKTLPDVKDMKMGDEITMKCKFKVKGLREDYNDKKDVMCEMDMTACEVEDGSDDYKESKRLGLDRKTFDEYKKKKESKNA